MLSKGILVRITAYEHLRFFYRSNRNEITEHHCAYMCRMVSKKLILIISIWLMKLQIFHISEDWRVGTYSRGHFFDNHVSKVGAYWRGRLIEALRNLNLLVCRRDEINLKYGIFGGSTTSLKPWLRLMMYDNLSCFYRTNPMPRILDTLECFINDLQVNRV